MEEKPVEIFEYRGLEIPIYRDDYGSQFYCIIDGKEIGFGGFNMDYKEDLKYIIDEKLDFIYEFDDSTFYGAKLKWFDNGGHRDIQLVFRNRILKVFLVYIDNLEISDSTLETLIYESQKIFKKLEEHSLK